MRRRIIMSLDGHSSSRRVRLAAGISLVMLALQVWRLAAWSGIPCAPRGIGNWIWPTLALVPPYLRILARPARLSSGVAVLWGGLNLTLAGVIIMAIPGSNGSALVTYWDVLGWVVCAGIQWIFVRSTYRAARTIAGAERIEPAFHVGYLFALLLLYSVWPVLLRTSQQTGWEGTAIGDLRALNSGQAFRRDTHPDRGYASTVEELQRQGFVSPTTMASTYGYRYNFAVGPRDESGSLSSYQAWANKVPPQGLCRNFFTNESGIVRFTREERPATAADSPIQ